MASPFAKYQSEQVQQIAPGFVEAYGNAGRSIGQGLANLGEGVATGIQEKEKKAKEESALKGALAPYIRNDQRVQVTEGLFKAGILTKAPDGTAVVSADYAGKVDMAALEKNLSFYNTTGGDGSKLSGDALAEFTARYQGEQKYVADQTAKAAAQVELEYKRAQIEELKSKAAERNANAGNYGAVISTLLGGEPAATPGVSLPSITLPDTTTPAFQSLTGQPVSKADTTEPGVAAPATATPVAAPAAAAPAPAAPAAVTPATLKPAEIPAAPAAKAPAAPAPAAKTPAAPAKAPAAPTAAPAPAAAPETYDVPAKSAEVAKKMQDIEARRTQVRTTYATRRTTLEGQIAAANRNTRLPSNERGMKMAQATLAFQEGRRKNLDEAEARDLKVLDDEADSIKTEFTNYQAAATAARQGRTEDRLGRAEQREIERDKAALTKAERDLRVGVAKDYPMISVFTYQGYGMKDPSTIGIQPMPGERYTEASEQIKGYNSAQDFLLNMKGILREREGASGNRLKEITQRFRMTAGNMENYFKAELASVFGVAAFRKPIVSGGNFSDADREFVRQAITYLNTAAPDMSNKDLESSLKALSFMINGLYQSQIEGLGMTYNPEAAKARAAALTTGGDKVGGATVSKQVERTDKFYKAFNLNQGSASSISRAEIDAARARLEATGFKFSAAKAKADNEAALKAAAGK